MAATADPGEHGHGEGGWRGGEGRGGGDRGGDHGGGRWREDGGGRPEGPPEGGRWGGRYPAQDGGPVYAEPPRRQVNSQPAPQPNSLGRDWREQQDEAREGVRRGQFQSMGQVLGRLRQRQPGRQLDAGLEQGADGRPVYRVRWAAANGRRIDYIIDARTGAILGEEGQ